MTNVPDRNMPARVPSEARPEPHRSPDEMSVEDLHRRTEAQREAVRETAEELGERLKERVQRAREPVERAVHEARARAERVDTFIRKHTWAFVAGSFVLGSIFGVRGGRRRRFRRQQRQLALLPPPREERVIHVEHERDDRRQEEAVEAAGRKTALGALGGAVLGKIGASLAREALSLAAERFETWRHQQTMEGMMSGSPDMQPQATEADLHGEYPPYPEHFEQPR